MYNKFNLTQEVEQVLRNSKSVTVPKNRTELFGMALGNADADSFDVAYEINGKMYTEVNVVRCKNGASVNYTEDYMRRRDPNSLVVADDQPTDKPKFKDLYQKDFSGLRAESLQWLSEQELVVVPFFAGGEEFGYEAVLIAPANAAFFACGLAGLQCFVNIDEYKKAEKFTPKLIIYLAPPFRHTHFDGKQVVVHNRTENLYEMFSYNLYPGPSAKKGVYGFLLDIGEKENWITAHASAVKVITPYENELVIMHEGASGGGKSEMGEHTHYEPDGKILVGKNLVTEENFYLNMTESCELRPIADDMALCHPKMQNGSQKLVIQDAEDGWFLRVDNIKEYGTEPTYEKICTQPSEPLVFMNIDGTPKASCLIWEHTLDSDGTPCPNPRVIVPRRLIPGIINGPVEVDVRSFGVRTPPTTAETPNYGIIGLLQVLPPALAWLWRLTAPRGHNNPSIISTQGMTSEGIGSYGPFLTGKDIVQANLLLEQIVESPKTRYVLIPNQHIGCYKVGFMPQWIVREYIAMRGGVKFKPEHLSPAPLPILGFGLEHLKIEGQFIPKAFLRPELQPELGAEGYAKGAEILTDFFKKEISRYNIEGINPLGKKIIDCCLNDGTLEDYMALIPMRF